MKICDKHGLDNPAAGKWTIIIPQEGSEFELCDECYLQFMEWVNEHKKKPGRPKVVK